MAKVRNYSGNGESIKSVWSNDGNKRYGFASKDQRADSQVPGRYTTRYGAGIDNLPLSGYNERSINTPLGTIDYGNDQDTAFAGFTPNLERTTDSWTGGSGQPMMADYYRSRLGDTILQAGRQGAQSNPDYFAGAFLPGDTQYVPTFEKSFNTPFGRAQIETNYDVPNSIDASFTPNAQTQYYLNAIAKMLGM